MTFITAKSFSWFALLAAVAAGSAASAQTLYRYRDANGVWVYTDRQPGAEQEFQEEQLQRRFERPEVRLY